VDAMTSWLVEGYASGSTDLAEIEERAREAASRLTLSGTPVRYVRTIFVREDETCFHVFEAPSVESVREAARRALLSVQRIVAAEP
jgi:hypothetical protein